MGHKCAVCHLSRKITFLAVYNFIDKFKSAQLVGSRKRGLLYILHSLHQITLDYPDLLTVNFLDFPGYFREV